MARTWYFEKEVVGDRVAGPSFLENDIGQEVVVINGNGSVIVHDERRPLVGDLVHAVDLVAWRQGKDPTWSRPTETGRSVYLHAA